MWDQHPMMKDWECMTDILLEAPDQEEDRMLSHELIATSRCSLFSFRLALDDQHENCLIEIMVCCVREAATGEYPIGRGQPNRKVCVMFINKSTSICSCSLVNNERTKTERR
jgi:cohesin complex subunit SA-1/2